MAEATRNVPPPFVLDVCACLAAVLSPAADEIDTVVQPEALRLLRMGRGKAEDVELAERLMHKLGGGRISLTDVQACHPNVRFLVMSWLMSASGMWERAVKNLLDTRCVPRSPRTVYTALPQDAASNLLLVDLVAMKYRTVIQKMNKYHELDRSRVKIFKDIYSLLTDVILQPTEGSDQNGVAGRRTDATSALKSGDIDEATGALWLSTSALNRLLDNLWTSATLYDTPRPTAGSSSAKRRGPAKGKTPSRSSASGGAKSAADTESGTTASTGMELLRVEYDLVRQRVSDAQQLAASETAYLKWAAGAATSLQVDDVSVALPPRWGYSAATVGTAAGAAVAAAAGAVGTPGAGDGSVASAACSSADTADATRFENLYKSVYGAVPVMAELEHCMYDLLDHHALNTQDVWAASEEVDAKYASMGLTIEEIDAYFDNIGEGSGGGEVGEKEVNVFELMDSVYRSGDPADGGKAGGDAPTDPRSGDSGVAVDGMAEDELRRYIQQELRIPLSSAESQVQKLREHNRDTLERIARVSEKFSPFAFVWAKHET